MKVVKFIIAAVALMLITQPQALATNYAVLIGVSKYPQPNQDYQLNGPAIIALNQN